LETLVKDLRDALIQIEAIIDRRIEGEPGERPSAARALYLIDRLAREALGDRLDVDGPQEVTRLSA
jgi:hypothetical protein